MRKRKIDHGHTRTAHRMTSTGPAAAPSTAPTSRRLVHLAASRAYRSQVGHYDQRTDAFSHWRELLVTQPRTVGEHAELGNDAARPS